MDVTSPHRGLTSAYQPARTRYQHEFYENIGPLFGFIKGETVTTPLADIVGKRNQHDLDRSEPGGTSRSMSVYKERLPLPKCCDPRHVLQ